MYAIGQEEVDAIRKVFESGKPFRYFEGGQCETFEKRYAEFIGLEYVHMTSSGTTAITACLAGLGIGPGDEVLVPACTYMATAVAVLAVGAIPVIIDIDESVTIDPGEIAKKAGPATRAVIPVHMWGLPCDMDRIMDVADRYDLLVIEDACQGVGGGYKDQMLGSIGDAGAFSFNYFKNMTCGEGGAAVTNDDKVFERIKCMIDCCGMYWNGRSDSVDDVFSNAGSRASEIEGAIMNVQLDRLPKIIKTLRHNKFKILEATVSGGLKPIQHNSPESECGSHLMYLLSDNELAVKFAEAVGGCVASQTGRHVYTEWDQILSKKGAHHPLMNPYNMPANKHCRMNYDKQMCQRSLDILNRVVFIGMQINHSDTDLQEKISLINSAKAKLGL
jgi:dTDP-4-amino-4,6-dideoxygalactose transaminase